MHSIWAVATNTLRQALRMKIAVVFLLLLLVLLPVMGMMMGGDGTLKGRLQTFVSYGLSLTSFLLCSLTIIVSVYSVTSDIEQRQIFTVITKPIRRFQFLFGKLLGVLLLDGALLIIFSAIIYAVIVCIPKFSPAPEAERVSARNEFFTARAGLLPPAADVSKEVMQTYKKHKESGELEQMYPGRSPKQIIADITKRKRLEKRAAGPGHELIWEFHNVKLTDAEASLFVRFKYDVSQTPPDQQVYGKWLVGDLRQIKYGGAVETPIRDIDRKDLIRTFHEIEVPGDVVADDGYVAVGFLNDPRLNSTVVFFPLDDGLELLYKSSSFGANFARAVLLIGLRLVFLAVLAILASTFLSLPVAILLCLVVFLTATVSGFVIDSFDYLSADLSRVYKLTVRPIVQLVPQFDKFNPGRMLVSARLVSWFLLAKVAGVMICIKAALLWLLALMIFHYREIARVTV